MIQIENTIISSNIFDKYFVCDLKACKGVCCVEGDSGAPLTQAEVELIRKYYPEFKKYLSEVHQNEIGKQGYSIIDFDGDLVTPLHNNQECVYAYTDENGITKCAIERAFLNDEIDFQKPLSCHLFPIRITSYKDFDAINYQQLDICKQGRLCGSQQKVPLFRFLREPLIRKYGSKWYREVEMAAAYIKKQHEYN